MAGQRAAIGRSGDMKAMGSLPPHERVGRISPVSPHLQVKQEMLVVQQQLQQAEAEGVAARVRLLRSRDLLVERAAAADDRAGLYDVFAAWRRWAREEGVLPQSHDVEVKAAAQEVDLEARTADLQREADRIGREALESQRRTKAQIDAARARREEAQRRAEQLEWFLARMGDAAGYVTNLAEIARVTSTTTGFGDGLAAAKLSSGEGLDAGDLVRFVLRGLLSELDPSGPSTPAAAPPRPLRPISAGEVRSQGAAQSAAHGTACSTPSQRNVPSSKAVAPFARASAAPAAAVPRARSPAAAAPTVRTPLCSFVAAPGAHLPLAVSTAVPVPAMSPSAVTRAFAAVCGAAPPTTVTTVTTALPRSRTATPTAQFRALPSTPPSVSRPLQPHAAVRVSSQAAVRASTPVRATTPPPLSHASLPMTSFVAPPPASVLPAAASGALTPTRATSMSSFAWAPALATTSLRGSASAQSLPLPCAFVAGTSSATPVRSSS
eukprot:TRINITY_DN31276_c0_g1_i1.p1 TRINITY_DN31276_c0_g1~~TRINITY_DN31276_c0_g1_i1.p1  ORF type:complete len:519 (+),score=102.35 TRINITY_DN31276_c0_g1_i1:77-1558(+)